MDKMLVLLFVTIISKIQGQCTTVHYPVGLRANTLETKYLSMDTDSSGTIVLGGSTMSASLFQAGDVLSGTPSYGSPIF